MITTYILEYWDPILRCYIKGGEYHDIKRAEIMFNKPYWRRVTRRLVKYTKEILYKDNKEK